MNPETKNCNCGPKVAFCIAGIGAFLIVAFLVMAMRHYIQVPVLNANRAAERAKIFAEMRASEAEALNNAAWLDAGKGIVRLPIEDAKKLVEQEWKNPAAARSNLIARVEKATFVPATAAGQAECVRVMAVLMNACSPSLSTAPDIDSERAIDASCPVPLFVLS